MTSDVGIRPDAETPVQTQVSMTTAKQLARRCAHGRLVWVIGGQRWHAKSDAAGEENVLEPCGGKG